MIKEIEIADDYFSSRQSEPFVIEKEISQFHKNWVEIYVSIIDENINNRVIISSTSNKSTANLSSTNILRENYLNAYNEIMGLTVSYFQNASIKDNHPKYLHASSNETSILNKTDDILLGMIALALDKETEVRFIVMRNIFYYHFTPCNNSDTEQSMDWLSFYDINLIIPHMKFPCDNFIFKNFSQVVKISNDIEPTEYIQQNNFSNILQNTQIKKKLQRFRLLHGIITRHLTSRTDCQVNLKNYLTDSDLRKIKYRLEEVEKCIVMIESFLAYDNESQFEDKFNMLVSKINELSSLLDKFHIGTSNSGIDSLFFFFLFLIVAYGIVLVIRTFKDMKEAFRRKIN